MISGDLWAGAEVMAYHLLKGLQKFEELDIQVVLLNEGRLSEEIRNLGIRAHVVDESRNSLVSTFRTMREILRKEKPDIIHSHGYKVNILSYLISRSINTVKLIATQHGMPKMPGRKYNPRYQFISRLNLFLLSRYFHRVVGVSGEIKKAFVKQYRFREDKVGVIHNGIEIPDSPVTRDNNEYFVIGSSGRLFPVKNYAFMIEIARVMQKKTNRVRFQLAGDGPEMIRLKALVSRYHLDDVFTFRGHLQNISLFYEGLDLYLNTSINEGTPMSVLEAMAHKLPVVAPRVGGFPEIVDDGVQGYLLEERNPGAFAEKCLFLSDNEPLRQKMSEAARKKVEQRFSMEQMAQNYFNLYADLMQGH
jgi:glycosyltransferase involved in cell wall biosynthesis